MGLLEKFFTGKFIAGKKMDEPYLSIYHTLLWALAIVFVYYFVEGMSYVTDFINYVIY